MKMQYDAFISYRHSELDMEIAKKVHTGLETYHIPGSVRAKTGKKKMGRVFRDQEELPIGSDLDDNISSALANSEYLIVICSPRTPGSYWVCKEIETFISMHGRSHILAVLIEGEPDESFPKQLLSDDNGEPVEPLAADVRGENRKERNSKFKTEILRLAAPIIGCSYDDLKQRHRERIIKRTLISVSAIAGVVAAAGIAFGIYNSNVADRMKQLADEKAALADEKAALADEKTRLADEILVEFKQKQENQSRFYAEESISLLNEGRREEAVLVAREGLPVDGDRPYVPEAEDALGRALYAYADGNSLGFDRILKSDLSVNSIKRTSDSSKIIVIDSGYNVYVYDSTTWELLSGISAGVDEYNYLVNTVGADADDTGVYVCTENSLIKYDYNGDVIYDNPEYNFINNFSFIENERVIYMVSSDTVYVADCDTGELLYKYENESEYSFFAGKSLYDEYSGIYVCPHNELNASKIYVSLIDRNLDSVKRVELSEGSVLEMCILPSGDIAALSCNSDFISGGGVKDVMLDVFSSEGQMLWSRKVDAGVRNAATFDSRMKAHRYGTDGKERDEIVITMEYEAFAYDASTGEQLSKITLGGESVSLSIAKEGPTGYVGYSNGNIDLIDFANSKIYSDYSIRTGLSLSDAVFVNGQVVVRSYLSPEVHILAYHEAPDLEELETFDTRVVTYGVSPDSGYYVIKPLGDYSTFLFYDDQGKKIYTYTGDMDFNICTGYSSEKFLIAYTDGIAYIDPGASEEDEVSWSKMGADDHVGYGNFCDNGKFGIFWDMHYLVVVDTDKRQVIYSDTLEEKIESAEVSEDGIYAYVATSESGLTCVSIPDGEKKPFDSDDLRNLGDAYFGRYIAISHDGSKLAMGCMDGMLRIADTGSLEVLYEIPFLAKSRIFLKFTDDDRYLVSQGDDMRICIRDTENGECINSIDGITEADSIICDDTDSIMAVCDGIYVYLFETGGYGLKARIEDGLIYLKSDNSAILCYDGRYMYKTFYKDHKTLIEEAGRQFPDAELSDEQKVKYNIEK